MMKCLHVCSEPSEADKQLGLHLEGLGELGRDGFKLDTQAAVGRNADAVFAGHGDNRRAVVGHDRHDE